MDERDEELVEPVAVRATIHLPGLRVGETAVVDPSEPYIAEALASESLVPLEGG